jgi:hypothetical protein
VRVWLSEPCDATLLVLQVPPFVHLPSIGNDLGEASALEGEGHGTGQELGDAALKTCGVWDVER